MTSKVDIGEAARMREEGKTLQEIGDHFGVTRERVRQLLGPLQQIKSCAWCGSGFVAHTARMRCCSRLCSARLSDRKARKECVDCGCPVGRRSARCVDCFRDQAARARNEKFARIQKLWLEGLPQKEIADRLGFANANCLNPQMAHMKAAGWDLPPRRKGWRGTRGSGPAKRPPVTRRQVNARLRYAIRTGRVTPADACERCGHEGHVDGHHHDYSKPLDVEWLCRPCHLAEHGRGPVELEQAA